MSSQKGNNIKRIGKFARVYWLIFTLLFVGYNLIFHAWSKTWFSGPTAALIFWSYVAYVLISSKCSKQ